MYSEYLFCKGNLDTREVSQFWVNMIKVKIDETIVDIVEKIEAQESGDIVLDFPLWHPILHNYISLKILKSKVGNRKLIIATNDRIGKKIWKQLWIEYSVVKDNKFYTENTHSKLLEHNFTFWEYFKFQIRSYISELGSIIHTNKKINSINKYRQRYNSTFSMTIFMGGFVCSCLLFLFVYYFVISKSYIYITPEIIVRKEAHNFIFWENSENSILWNNKNIKIKKLFHNTQLKETYSSTQIQNNSQDRSRWSIMLYNKLDQEQTLIPNTRFQSSDGLLYEVETWVKVPPAIIDNFWNISPGSVTITIRSKTKDTSGNYIGTRWDIPAETPLILPGLPENLRESIYAKTIENFSWGNDTFQKIVSQDDIDNALSLFEEKLKNEAISEVRQNISYQNSQNSTQIDILSGPESIRYKNLKIEVEEGVVAGSTKESFHISWSIDVEAYTFNKESIIQKLKTLVNERKIDGIEKISHIDESSLRMSEIIYTEERPFEMKATFEIEALFLHDFLHRENTYMELLKSEIRWFPKEKAEKILLNDPRISSVEIKIRPFFSKSISNIYNNIIFKIR